MFTFSRFQFVPFAKNHYFCSSIHIILLNMKHLNRCTGGQKTALYSDLLIASKRLSFVLAFCCYIMNHHKLGDLDITGSVVVNPVGCFFRVS